jgi:transcriptional regulator with XRE-family HTH domain
MATVFCCLGNAEEDYMMKFSETLKALIAKRYITIRDFSRAVNIRESTIKTWLRGSSPRDLSDVRAAARYFEVSLEFLLFGEEEVLPRTLEEIPLDEVYEGWIKVKIHAPARSKFERTD